jgi:L-malate glycosyltransferase
VKILLLSETLEPGGAETFVVRLANALAADHDVTLAVMHGERIHPDIAGNLSQCVRLESLRLPAKSLLWKLNSALRRAGIDWSPLHALHRNWLRRLVDERRSDIIHSHLIHADRLATELRGDGGPRHVMTVHGDYGPYLQGLADPQMLGLEAQIGRIAGRADAIVCTSHRHLDLFAEHYPQSAAKLELIYNGYEPPAAACSNPGRSELGLPLDVFLFGMVSRGVALKGWAEAVAAFERLGRCDTALVLVGEGPAIDELRRRPLPKEVILAGFSAKPIEYIRHVDVGLLPTRFPHESLPTVIMEYLHCGKPVIATDVGEIRAMIASPGGRQAGLLLSRQGGAISVQELAEAMAGMLDDPAALAEFQSAAPGAFAKFDMGECTRCYSELYERIIAAPAQELPRTNRATAERSSPEQNLRPGAWPQR